MLSTGDVQFDIQPTAAEFEMALSRWAGDVRSLKTILKEVVRKDILPAFEDRFNQQGPGWQPLSRRYSLERLRTFGHSRPILDRHKGATGLKYRATRTLEGFWKFEDRRAYLDVASMRASPPGSVPRYGFIHMSGGAIQPQRTWVNMRESELQGARDTAGDWVAEQGDKNLRWIF